MNSCLLEGRACKALQVLFCNLGILIKSLFNIQSLITIQLYQFTSQSLFMCCCFSCSASLLAWQCFDFAFALRVCNHFSGVGYSAAFTELRQHNGYYFDSIEMVLQNFLFIASHSPVFSCCSQWYLANILVSWETLQRHFF